MDKVNIKDTDTYLGTPNNRITVGAIKIGDLK